ncbi:hypothetical protein EHQ52_04860 [Leptospira koniambonensis]|uniref:Uncharacterized protein n=1 Tax=Leptospira koniambonensis TaxID=2484950 RepID=A0A4R9J5F7_9LEPT|nr:hypothetical protein [Leptospira koniambonensis]TGL33863.1 hypothetical protein EHQ52_04860 [Leptospira koniambonensis]
MKIFPGIILRIYNIPLIFSDLGLVEILYLLLSWRQQNLLEEFGFWRGFLQGMEKAKNDGQTGKTGFC